MVDALLVGVEGVRRLEVQTVAEVLLVRQFRQSRGSVENASTNAGVLEERQIGELLIEVRVVPHPPAELACRHQAFIEPPLCDAAHLQPRQPGIPGPRRHARRRLRRRCDVAELVQVSQVDPFAVLSHRVIRRGQGMALVDGHEELRALPRISAARIELLAGPFAIRTPRPRLRHQTVEALHQQLPPGQGLGQCLFFRHKMQPEPGRLKLHVFVTAQRQPQLAVLQQDLVRHVQLEFQRPRDLDLQFHPGQIQPGVQRVLDGNRKRARTRLPRHLRGQVDGRQAPAVPQRLGDKVNGPAAFQ